MNRPFTPAVQYTAIALAYQNSQLIADMVLPRTKVLSETFKWTMYNKDDAFTVPNTLFGRRSRANQVEFGAEEKTASTKDYGIEFVVPNSDIAAANGSSYNPLSRSVITSTNLLLLDREVRVAKKVFSTQSYDGNTKTLAGQEQWSDYEHSDPISDILEAKDSMLAPANTLVLGKEVFSALQRHPKIIAAMYPLGGNAALGGIAPEQSLKTLLGFDNIYIGQAWLNVNKRGQSSSLQRVWGKSAALLHISPIAEVHGNDITFGMTAQYGQRQVVMDNDKLTGIGGSIIGNVAESVIEVITAPGCGFLFDKAVA